MASQVSTHHTNLHALVQPFVGSTVVGASLPGCMAAIQDYGTRETIALDLHCDTGRLELVCFTFGGAEQDDHILVRTPTGEHTFWWGGRMPDGTHIQSISARDGLRQRDGTSHTEPEWLGPEWEEARPEHVLANVQFSNQIHDVVLESGSAAVVFEQCVFVVTRRTGWAMEPLPATKKAYVRTGSVVAQLLPTYEDD